MRLAAAAYPLDQLADFDAYAAKISRWVGEAAVAGAELLVFPEYAAMELASLGGPAVAADLEASLREVARHGPAAGALHARLAAQHGITILAASAPVWPDGAARPVNRAILYGPDGVIGHQDKQIMTRFEREDWDVAPGRDGLAVLQTPLGPVGIIICYDSEFPLLARHLVEAGARLLLAPSATETPAGFYRVRVGAQARALENQCVVIHAPIVGPAAWCEGIGAGSGRAALYGPPDLGFPDDGIIAQTAPDAPGWAIADIDDAAIDRVRQQGNVLNHAHWPEQQRAITPPRR